MNKNNSKRVFFLKDIIFYDINLLSVICFGHLLGNAIESTVQLPKMDMDVKIPLLFVLLVG